ncbi:hypothetical protein QL285_097477 [Trifolium repens]|nr:hypothetical protein QL285_098846 [Trifolium repens]KAK2351186.1 hypothetical protein QL285_097477 [Trifolium repens]
MPPGMNDTLVVYGNTTQSDMDFIMETDTNFPSFPSSASSSPLSDAQSAAPDLDLLFNQICEEYYRCVHEAGRVVPPEWTMPDLVRATLGEEALQQHGLLTDAYYDVMLCGTRSWGCEELLHFLDLINYVY